MTTELEEQFFETFEIPKQFILPVEKFKYSYKNYKEAYKINRACNNWEHQETIDELKKGKYEYPTITDRILLELICIAMDVTDFGASDVETLKNVVLEVLINEIKSKYSTKKKKKHIVNQVQELFKER